MGHADRVVQRQAGVGKRTVWISILTLLSRILGLVREVISAALFGDASKVYDAFLFAWRIPNLFRRFLGEGALATSLQTALTAEDSTNGDQAGGALFGATFALLASMLAALSTVVMLGIWLMPDCMPGTEFLWLGSEPQVVRELTIRLMPFVVFVCLTAAAGGALNVRGHYTMPAIGPVLLNGVWIGALLLIRWSAGNDPSVSLEAQLPLVRWLAGGVLMAGLVQLVVLLPAMRSCGLWGSSVPILRHSSAAWAGARGVLKRSLPLALGAAVYQVNVMIDGMMAQGLLPDGGQTVHYLANRVQQFPLALVAVAATTAVFPALAALGQQRRLEDLRGLHDRTQRNVLFVALPATFGLAALALPVTSALFEHGNFEAQGIERMANALRILAFAILPAGAVGLVARTYYSMGDFKTPVRMSCSMLLANVGLNFLFLRWLGMDADGLALATTLSSFGNLFLLLPGLKRRLGLPPALPGFPLAFTKMLIAAGLCGLAANLVSQVKLPGLAHSLHLLLAIGAGVGAYVLGSMLLKVPECAHFAPRIHRVSAKFRRK